MNTYSLNTLLKIRERNHDMAKRHLIYSSQKLEEEEQKLKIIKKQIELNKQARAEMQDHFFLKAQSAPCNKHEVNSLAMSSQKNISDEATLQNSLDLQINRVKNAADKKEQAHLDALTAQRALKTINKHHNLWQQREKKCEELKEEYNTDDQNGVRFWLKRA